MVGDLVSKMQPGGTSRQGQWDILSPALTWLSLAGPVGDDVAVAVGFGGAGRTARLLLLVPGARLPTHSGGPRNVHRPAALVARARDLALQQPVAGIVATLEAIRDRADECCQSSHGFGFTDPGILHRNSRRRASLFERIHDAGWRFDDVAHLRAFLVRATTNRFIDRQRQHGKHQHGG
jgi:hypothetical protein